MSSRPCSGTTSPPDSHREGAQGAEAVTDAVADHGKRDRPDGLARCERDGRAQGCSSPTPPTARREPGEPQRRRDRCQRAPRPAVPAGWPVIRAAVPAAGSAPAATAGWPGVPAGPAPTVLCRAGGILAGQDRGRILAKQDVEVGADPELVHGPGHPGRFELQSTAADHLIGGQGFIGREPEPAQGGGSDVFTPQLDPGIPLRLLSALPGCIEYGFLAPVVAVAR